MHSLVNFSLAEGGIVSKNDTTFFENFKTPDSLYKLKRTQFHLSYDYDDTAHAMIDYAFNQRQLIVGMVKYSRKGLYEKLSVYKELRHLSSKKERKQVIRTMKKAEYRLSRNEFLTKYGKDDSAKALINIFFNDRTLGWIALPAYPLLITLPGIINNRADLRYYNEMGTMSRNGTINLFFGEYITTGIIAMGATTSGIFIINNTSRKKLLYYLKFYNENGYLHPNHHERVMNRIDRKKTDELYQDYKTKQRQEEKKKMLEEYRKK